MYSKIVVPLDGSTFGENALPLALSIARRSNAQLILTHVYAPLIPFYGEGMAYLDARVEEGLKQERKSYLDKVKDRVPRLDVPLATQFLEGPVSASIAEYAKSSGADLVVMTTHARNPVSRFWLGSVADEMLRNCTVPMLLVPPSPDSPDLGRDVRFEHLMVALDGSEFAERVVGPAEQLAKLMEAKVTLLRAVEFQWPSPYPAEYVDVASVAGPMAREVDSLQARLERQAQEYLSGVAETLRGHGLDVTTHVAVQDSPSSAILQTSEDEGCDSIAIETRGRRGVARFFLGSVADKVIRGTTLPILVHRPEDD